MWLCLIRKDNDSCCMVISYYMHTHTCSHTNVLMYNVYLHPFCLRLSLSPVCPSVWAALMWVERFFSRSKWMIWLEVISSQSERSALSGSLYRDHDPITSRSSDNLGHPFRSSASHCSITATLRLSEPWGFLNNHPQRVKTTWVILSATHFPSALSLLSSVLVVWPFRQKDLVWKAKLRAVVYKESCVCLCTYVCAPYCVAFWLLLYRSPTPLHPANAGNQGCFHNPQPFILAWQLVEETEHNTLEAVYLFWRLPAWHFSFHLDFNFLTF